MNGVQVRTIAGIRDHPSEKDPLASLVEKIGKVQPCWYVTDSATGRASRESSASATYGKGPHELAASAWIEWGAGLAARLPASCARGSVVESGGTTPFQGRCWHPCPRKAHHESVQLERPDEST
jgi:hypothetical protein